MKPPLARIESRFHVTTNHASIPSCFAYRSRSSISLDHAPTRPQAIRPPDRAGASYATRGAPSSPRSIHPNSRTPKILEIPWSDFRPSSCHGTYRYPSPDQSRPDPTPTEKHDEEPTKAARKELLRTLCYILTLKDCKQGPLQEQPDAATSPRRRQPSDPSWWSRSGNEPRI